jgi:hypothetical protein
MSNPNPQNKFQERQAGRSKAGPAQSLNEGHWDIRRGAARPNE